MRRVGLGVVIAVLAAGCGGPTQGRPFGGAYDLVTIDGRSVPQPLDVNAGTQVVGGSLDVAADTLHLTLDVQAVDSGGRGTGDITPMLSAIPYIRQGDSLLVVVDTAGQGDALFGGLTPGGNQRIGAVVGSDVELDYSVWSIPSSTGFAATTKRLLFAPVR